MNRVDGGRRAFLRGAFLSRNGRVGEVQRRLPLGPAPPWHRGQPLETHCPGCSHPCTAACDPGIIQRHPADHELAGVPYLDFSSAGCTFCKACVEVCPMEFEVIDAPAPRIGKARLNRDTCIAWDDVICMACSQRCDYQAITTVHQRRAQIDTEVCTGCGMCVAVCPMDALEITFPG